MEASGQALPGPGEELEAGVEGVAPGVTEPERAANAGRLDDDDPARALPAQIERRTVDHQLRRPGMCEVLFGSIVRKTPPF